MEMLPIPLFYLIEFPCQYTINTFKYMYVAIQLLWIAIFFTVLTHFVYSLLQVKLIHVSFITL